MKRVVLITGVAGGIGHATAEVFAEAGWHVVGVGRKSTPGLSGVHHFIHADVSEPQDTARIYAEVAEQEGRLDGLVNNAAVQICKPLLEMTPKEWDTVMSNNLRSVFLGMRHAYPLLHQQKGAIVNVSSVHAVATSRNIAAYAASKGALLALTRAMALEFGPDGIRVNAILPGAVDTKMLRAGLERGHVEGDNIEALIRGLGTRHVLGRVGHPEEIGRAILFLADNTQSSFMTGQALIVDGGATARLSTE
ncbi:MAG: SDR family oxidoreductase [Chloroflexota bacterium]|nr:SDR family oxidoreductase [Chloroflexota bacterium]